MAQLNVTNCDVCSEEMLSQTALMNHIQLHLSQFNRLINRSLSHYFAELGDDVGTDADSGHSTTPLEKKPPAKRLKVWKCPCKTCDHGAFRRKQELVRHYATHYICDRTCICSITFHLGGKYLYHDCKAGQSTKDRWVLLRPELEGVLNEALTKTNAGSRRREKSARRPMSLRSPRRRSSDFLEDPPRDSSIPGIRPQVLNRTLPLASEKTSFNRIGIPPIAESLFPEPNGAAIATCAEDLGPSSAHNALAPFQESLPIHQSNAPLFWESWGSGQRQDVYLNAQNWDSSRGQDQTCFST